MGTNGQGSLIVSQRSFPGTRRRTRHVGYGWLCFRLVLDRWRDRAAKDGGDLWEVSWEARTGVP
jgi:hypothetical protein